MKDCNIRTKSGQNCKKIGGRAVFCASPWGLGLGAVSPKQIACF